MPAGSNGASDAAISVNSDMGEAIAIHSFGNDKGLLEIVDTINLACGLHAGDPSEMSRTVREAIDAGVSIGAHPGLPDIVGFGRRFMALDPDEVRDLVLYQVGALSAFLSLHGAPLSHIKPHGALYAMVARSEPHMHALCDAASVYGVPIFGLSGTYHETVCQERGQTFVSEFYVDVDYDDDGTVIVQRKPKPRELSDVEERVWRALTKGTVRSIGGRELPVTFDSICVHSDLPNAIVVAQTVRRVLTAYSDGEATGRRPAQSDMEGSHRR